MYIQPEKTDTALTLLSRHPLHCVLHNEYTISCTTKPEGVTACTSLLFMPSPTAIVQCRPWGGGNEQQ